MMRIVFGQGRKWHLLLERLNAQVSNFSSVAGDYSTGKIGCTNNVLYSIVRSTLFRAIMSACFLRSVEMKKRKLRKKCRLWEIDSSWHVKNSENIPWLNNCQLWKHRLPMRLGSLLHP